MKQQIINQIYCAAPALSYCPWIPAAAWDELSKLILHAQYECCICCAVLFLDVPVFACVQDHVLCIVREKFCSLRVLVKIVLFGILSKSCTWDSLRFVMQIAMLIKKAPANYFSLCLGQEPMV